MNNKPKTGGIKEIARTLGISIGTVDRVLHNRPGISLKTKGGANPVTKELPTVQNSSAPIF
jgi:LacI family transcriptional regulator